MTDYKHKIHKIMKKMKRFYRYKTKMQYQISHGAKISVYLLFVISYLLYVLFVIVFSGRFLKTFTPLTNISGSMNPVINEGSITIVKQENFYNVGDVISYYTQIDGKEAVITHRIKSIGGNVYVTKGDANQVTDRELVVPRLVIGKVVLVMPYIGFIVRFAKSPLGLLLTIYLPGFMIISREILRIISDVKYNKFHK